MGEKNRICNCCNKQYYGQGKLYCSIECRNFASKGKPQKKRSNETKLKLSEIHKGKKISNETKIKISNFQKKLWEDIEYKKQQTKNRLGRIQSDETKKKISDSQKGIPRPSTTLYNKNRPKVFGWNHTEDSKKKISEKVSGNKNGMYGKIPKFSKYSLYENNNIIIKMRSTWEVIYAKYLDSLGFTWEYEKHTFILNDNNTYTPDFYCNNIFYEVKGYLHPHSKIKMDLFIEQYPEHTLIIVDREYLKKLNLIK